MFNPNLVLVRKRLLRFPQTGGSSLLRIQDAIALSRFSDTHVFKRSCIVKCYEFLESK